MLKLRGKKKMYWVSSTRRNPKPQVLNHQLRDEEGVCVTAGKFFSEKTDKRAERLDSFYSHHAYGANGTEKPKENRNSRTACDKYSGSLE